jgi:hypothetical protein
LFSRVFMDKSGAQDRVFSQVGGKRNWSGHLGSCSFSCFKNLLCRLIDNSIIISF